METLKQTVLQLQTAAEGFLSVGRLCGHVWVFGLTRFRVKFNTRAEKERGFAEQGKKIQMAKDKMETLKADIEKTQHTLQALSAGT